MIEPMTESEDSLQNEKDKNIALLVYLLLGLGFLTGGLTAVAAMIINYIKMDDIRGTWIERHLVGNPFSLAAEYLLVWTVVELSCFLDMDCSSWVV